MTAQNGLFRVGRINICHFEDVNNTLNFDNRDVLLNVAERLSSNAVIRARIGSDECLLVFAYDISSDV